MITQALVLKIFVCGLLTSWLSIQLTDTANEEKLKLENLCSNSTYDNFIKIFTTVAVAGVVVCVMSVYVYIILL